MASDAPKPKDLFLIEFLARDPAAPALSEALAAMRRDPALSIMEFKAVQALSEPRVTLYLGGVPFAARTRVVARAQEHLSKLADGGVEVSRLSAQNMLAGASYGAASSHHLVVRTNVPEGAGHELERWYDEEHLIGLAAVPGCTLAQRLISLDALPRYYACYDIVSPQVIETPTWLKVRETEWSSHVRPTFRDTRRVVSRRIDQETAS
ncbi:MAG TPA: hypothetical protein VGC36_02695 [Rhizomicrobium sp.]